MIVKKPHPQRCQLCAKDIVGEPFVDGRTKWGPWANICLSCHEDYGCGLGLGRGQKYDKEGIKTDG